MKHTKTAKTRKIGIRGKGVDISIEFSAPKAEAKMHKFMDAWKKHIHDEIRIHRELLEGKRNLGKHLDDTIKIHEKFVKELRKI